MRTNKISTLPAPLKIRGFKPGDAQLLLFRNLVGVLKPYSTNLHQVSSDMQYGLWTRHVHRTRSNHPENKPGILFAGLSIRKDYVGFYFYPLLINKQLEASISETLLPLKHQNTAFRITSFSDQLMTDVDDLLQAGWKYYQSLKWV